MLINAQSLLNKIDQLRLVCALKKPSIICITESWLHDSIDSAMIALPGFSVYRNDRIKRRGGGTCIYISTSIAHLPLPMTVTSQDIELTAIELPDMKLILLCMYVPPDLTSRQLSNVEGFLVSLSDNLLSLKPYHRLIITGDMNSFNTNELCGKLCLTDLVTKPTRLLRILDHILISNELFPEYHSDSVSYDAPLGNADHLVVTAHPANLIETENVASRHRLYDLRLSNVQNLYQAISEINWTPLSNISDIDEQWNIFYCILTTAIQDCIPSRVVTLKTSDKAWMTPLTKSLINDRWTAFRNKNWELYNHLKQKTKREIINSKRIWAKKLTSSPRGLWQLIKEETKQENTMSALIKHHKSTQNVLEIVSNALSTFFSNKDAEEWPSFSNDYRWSPEVTEEKVRKLLSKLPERKACGPDDIPTKIYNILADVISKPLTEIFNNSLKNGTFVKDWKHGIITPIPKTNPPDINKLRFVTLLSLPAKLLEKIVFDSLRFKFEEEYGPHQHGFRRSHSTTTALIDVLDKITNQFDDVSSFGTAVLSYDLSRAFDTVDHSHLVNRLKSKSFPERFLQWLSCYLSDRSAIVRIDGKISKRFCIKRGLPQGSVLAPPLFCVFVSDLSASSDRAATVKYADDLNVILPLPSRSPSDINDSIAEETKHIADWCEANKLELNVTKSMMMILSRQKVTFPQPTVIPVVEQMKVLGVIIDNQLSWKPHIKRVNLIASRKFYILRRIKKLVTKDQLHLAYTAMIRSVLEYASPVFVGLGKKLSKYLSKIDNRAHRIIYNIPYDSEYNVMCGCNKDIITNRRLLASSNLFKQIQNNHLHILQHRVPSFTHKRFIQPYCRTTKRLNSFFPYVTRLQNVNMKI